MADIEMNVVERAPFVPNPDSAIGVLDVNDAEVVSKLDDTEGGKNSTGWFSMILGFLKLLLFGLAVFIYDMYSKLIFPSIIKYSMRFIANSLFCSKINLTYFKISKGDTQVGIDHIKDGNIVWGCTVIMLQLLPNVVFIVWFILANQGHLREAGTWKKIAIAGSVQLVTLIR